MWWYKGKKGYYNIHICYWVHTSIHTQEFLEKRHYGCEIEGRTEVGSPQRAPKTVDPNFNKDKYFRSAACGNIEEQPSRSVPVPRMAARDNPNRVSRLNKNPFVLKHLLILLMYLPNHLHTRFTDRRRECCRGVPSTFYNCFLGRGL